MSDIKGPGGSMGRRERGEGSWTITSADRCWRKLRQIIEILYFIDHFYHLISNLLFPQSPQPSLLTKIIRFPAVPKYYANIQCNFWWTVCSNCGLLSRKSINHNKSWNKIAEINSKTACGYALYAFVQLKQYLTDISDGWLWNSNVDN